VFPFFDYIIGNRNFQYTMLMPRIFFSKIVYNPNDISTNLYDAIMFPDCDVFFSSILRWPGCVYVYTNTHNSNYMVIVYLIDVACLYVTRYDSDNEVVFAHFGASTNILSGIDSKKQHDCASSMNHFSNDS
jgi:hypothetical protein